MSGQRTSFPVFRGAPVFSFSTSRTEKSEKDKRQQQALIETPPSSPAETDCSHCTRPGAPLFCFSCGFWMANGRIAEPCPEHPKVIFYTDFKMCPKCKKPGFLRELD